MSDCGSSADAKLRIGKAGGGAEATKGKKAQREVSVSARASKITPND